jgi:RimJ/RimL family protein N-acetyltransferase
MQTFETERLVLRPLRVDDVDDYHAQIVGDMRVMEYRPPHLPLSRAQARAELRKLEASWHVQGFGLYAVLERDTQIFIGVCGIESTDNGNTLTLDCVLGADFRGQGYEQEAARAVIAAMQDAAGPDISNLVVLVDPHDTYTIAWVEAMGMRLDGSRLRRGFAVDYYALTDTSNTGGEVSAG